jgi:hypothetical protein
MNPGMRESRHLPLLAIVAVVLAVGAVAARRAEPRVAEGAEVAGARFRLDAADARRAGAPRLPVSARSAGFAFAPGTAPADRDAFLAAVAHARPPAARLMALVDGLTDVRIGSTGDPGALGVTETGAARYVVTVDLARVSARYGARGVDRVVLHEMGHVVDHALVADDAMAALQRGIPAGWGCDEGVSGACATAPERFAESFAKWATGDIGVDLNVGYKVPPPSPTLDAWGAPLDRLAAAAR